MKRSQNTNPAMVPKSISPHDMGRSGQAETGAEGHARLVGPGAGDPPGMQHEGMGVVSKYIDVRTPPIYKGRDTPLTYGGEGGRKPFQGDAITGEQKSGPQTHAPSIGTLEHGLLYGTQSADREGFAPPNTAVVMAEEKAAGTGTAKTPKSK